MNSYISKTLTGKSAVFLEEQGRYKKNHIITEFCVEFLNNFYKKILYDIEA
jgi:hypothetical protein